MLKRIPFALLLAMEIGCAAAGTAPPAEPIAAERTQPGRVLVPAGYGSLRQDDIALRMQAPGLILRAVPLDEGIIRLLTSDSYRALRDLQQSNRAATEAIARRSGGRGASVWLVSFYGTEPQTRFVPMDLLVTSVGRDFRPLDIIPLSTGFGEQRLQQRETQSALYIFDPDIDLNQPLSMSFQGARDDSWQQILQRVERERALVRARSSQPR